MKLYPYQEEGAWWLAARRHAGLFDDPGLGKTITAIRTLQLIDAQRTLVIAPTVALHNWRRELERWAPERRVQILGAAATKLDPAADTFVMSHGLVSRCHTKVRDIDVLLVDEAHAFKNPFAKRTRALYGCGRRLNGLWDYVGRGYVLTGTPMPNDPRELWTMLAHSRMTTLHYTAFGERYCHLREGEHGPFCVGLREENLPELREMMQRFGLRRRKRDYLNLPPVLWQTYALPLDDADEELRKMLAELSPAAAEIVDSDIEGSLRAIAGEEHLARYRRLTGRAKAPGAAEVLREELESNTLDKVVVFAHHLDVIDDLCERLRRFGIVRITGAESAKDRDTAVRRFSKPSVRVAVCQIQAAGVAITLTAAHEVVFVESSYVPGDMQQCADRCHRIGQSQPVRVRVMALDCPIDEAIAETLARKLSMIQAVGA